MIIHVKKHSHLRPLWSRWKWNRWLTLCWMTFDTDPNTKTQWLKQHPWVGEMVQWVKVFAPNLNIKKKAAAMFFRGLEVCPACMKPQVQASPWPTNPSPALSSALTMRTVVNGRHIWKAQETAHNVCYCCRGPDSAPSTYKVAHNSCDSSSKGLNALFWSP